jgi:ATP-dependent exoDNAse (exonuclease V) beta subunit
VLLLLQVINRMETEGVTSVRDFLDACAKDRDERFGLELPEHMLGVRLMTTYKAKGMGFPVVINLFADDGRKQAETYYAREGDQITIYRLTGKIAGHTAGFTPDLKELKGELDADAEVQELNSLYVGCTRAGDELYNLVSYKGPDKKGKRSAYSLLFPPCELGDRGSPREAASGEVVSPLASTATPQGQLPCEWQHQDAWTAARLAEIRRGEFFHGVLEGIAELPEDGPAAGGRLVYGQGRAHHAARGGVHRPGRPYRADGPPGARR